MNTFHKAIVFATLVFLGSLAGARDSSVGDIRIGHPYAVPSVPGSTTGAAYFADLENSGKAADTLLRISTPMAGRVELHTMSVDAQGVMRMREIDGIALAPGAAVKMRPGMGTHLMLIGLKQPLKEGTAFPMTLEFAKAGKIEVKVIVQVPKAPADMAEMQKH